MQSYFTIGVILKPQGLNGMVKVKPLTDDARRFLSLERAMLGGDRKVYTVSAAEVRGEFVYLNFEGVLTRDDAEKLRGLEIVVSRDDAFKASPDAYFIADLVGCRVVSTNGAAVGELVDVLQPGANDVYEIKTERGIAMIPALKDVVVSVDIENAVIVVDDVRFGEVVVWGEER